MGPIERILAMPMDPALRAEDAGPASEDAAAMVTQLYRIASLAQQGKVRSIAVAAVLEDEAVATFRHANDRVFTLAGALDWLKSEVLASGIHSPNDE